MNKIFKPLIDQLHLDVSVVVLAHIIGHSSICIVEIGSKTINSNSKRLIFTNFPCQKKACPNNQPYTFSNPAVVIVFEASWYRHAEAPTQGMIQLVMGQDQDLNLQTLEASFNFLQILKTKLSQKKLQFKIKFTIFHHVSMEDSSEQQEKVPIFNFPT